MTAMLGRVLGAALLACVLTVALPFPARVCGQTAVPPTSAQVNQPRPPDAPEDYPKPPCADARDKKRLSALYEAWSAADLAADRADENVQRQQPIYDAAVNQLHAAEAARAAALAALDKAEAALQASKWPAGSVVDVILERAITDAALGVFFANKKLAEAQDAYAQNERVWLVALGRQARAYQRERAAGVAFNAELQRQLAKKCATPPPPMTAPPPPPIETPPPPTCPACEALRDKIIQVDDELQALRRSQASMRANANLSDPNVQNAIAEDDQKNAALKQQLSALAHALDKCQETCAEATPPPEPHCPACAKLDDEIADIDARLAALRRSQASFLQARPDTASPNVQAALKDYADKISALEQQRQALEQQKAGCEQSCAPPQSDQAVSARAIDQHALDNTTGLSAPTNQPNRRDDDSGSPSESAGRSGSASGK